MDDIHKQTTRRDTVNDRRDRLVELRLATERPYDVRRIFVLIPHARASKDSELNFPPKE